ncbi:hypothetical protein PISMIDRAFT_631257 [Pisolithus microcarpus 441]|uniref:Uncharacterized protein n=1 Tax=Pisolithus microcarpus 441 TaxID=765257 RepID=A0A0C9YXF7_9AGAM|nr:hypothetical protein PISMIDRAFT_631257 [Pisolithus microcarpus 441]
MTDHQPDLSMAMTEPTMTGTSLSVPTTTPATTENVIPIDSPAIAVARPTMSSSLTINPTLTPVTMDKGKRREKSSERERESGGKIEKMEKLTNNNWSAWKKKMTAALHTHDLYDIIARQDPKPSMLKVDELKEWQK